MEMIGFLHCRLKDYINTKNLQLDVKIILHSHLFSLTIIKMARRYTRKARSLHKKSRKSNSKRQRTKHVKASKKRHIGKTKSVVGGALDSMTSIYKTPGKKTPLYSQYLERKKITPNQPISSLSFKNKQATPNPTSRFSPIYMANIVSPVRNTLRRKKLF
jgi:hypothetical protein